MLIGEPVLDSVSSIYPHYTPESANEADTRSERAKFNSL